MQLEEKVEAVNRLFAEADEHCGFLREKTGLQCLPDCSKCCMKSDIESTVLEFLPVAYHLYQTETYAAVLDTIESQTENICVFHNPFRKEGQCLQYPYRGLLCRLFGYSVRTDKHGVFTLITCKEIKKTIKNYPFDKTLEYAPRIADYYLKLYGIDPHLAVRYLPINQSIKKALEIVLMHFQFRKKPA
jgi:Fe-S-cluster containining protein